MIKKHIPEALRQVIIVRARHCCEYCLIAAEDSGLRFHLDHIVPEKHRGVTEEHNLCLSCPQCNRHKGTDFASLDPQDGALTRLYDPRQDRWTDHFALEGPVILPVTNVGRVTVFVLQLNLLDRVLMRKTLIDLSHYPPTEW